MITKKELKAFRSLKQKKFRTELGWFTIEGKKSVIEAMNSNLEIVAILSSNRDLSEKSSLVDYINQNEIDAISALKNAPDTICIAKIPSSENIDFEELKNELVIILDNIQDPGNLGTIIRIADWFGIKNIFCSTDTVDMYNSKTIQSTMGSFLRTKVHYIDLVDFIKKYSSQTSLSIYSTTLDGDNIYTTALPKSGAFIIGNEGKGISDEIQQLSSHKLFIPRFGEAESLNAGIATALICSEFRRSI